MATNLGMHDGHGLVAFKPSHTWMMPLADAAESGAPTTAYLYVNWNALYGTCRREINDNCA